MISERDDLTRAAVYAACDARGTASYRAAVDRIIFVHRVSPLIRYHDAILAAERDIEERLDLLDEKSWLTWELFPEIDVAALAAARSRVSDVAA